MICAVDPVARTGYRRKIEGGLPNAPTEQFTPLMVQLVDGSTWRMRSGGAGIETPDGYVPFYYCESGCDDGQALFGPAGGDGVEHSGPVWQARISDGYQPTELVDVSRAWFLVGGGVG